jgi:hypothetical protein
MLCTDDYGFSDARSEGERRGLAESRRSERLQSSEEVDGDDDAIV